MKTSFKVSIAFNLLILVVIIYLSIFGKDHVRDIIFKYVLEIRYQQRTSMFEACPVSKGAIIFLGNSITEGGNWDELFPDKVILNRGIGGDRTAGVYSRLDEVIRHQPSKLFICIGTNDIASGISQEFIMKNYSDILTTIRKKSPDTKIYVQSLLPVGKEVMTTHDNSKIPPLNAAIEQLCQQMNITFINVHDLFISTEGYLDPQYSNDELHLMGKAYLIWREKISGYINE